jgi:acetoacetyl-CoA synthetase
MRVSKADAPLWSPSVAGIADANLSRFARGIESRYGQRFNHEFGSLHRWSVQQPAAFWTAVLDQFGLHYTGFPEPAFVASDDPPYARWFPNVSLNYADNLLRWPGYWTALIESGEAGIGLTWSYSELRQRVAQHQQGLRAAGVGVGDCVAGILPNDAEAVAAMLAAASLGAAWASVSPDFGTTAALDRLGQVRPDVLYAVAQYRFNGKRYDVSATIDEIVRGLPGLRRLIRVGGGWPREATADESDLAAFLATAADAAEPDFVQVPFAQPLFILFTSGTTGAPKCIVHSHGGTLLQLLKEHQLHCDLRAQDRIVFPSTLGWMMWNWSVSALGSGATVVLYDGSLLAPDEQSIFALAEQLRINVLGLPSAFLERCRAGALDIASRYALPALRTLFAGGSVLSPEAFHYVYEKLAPQAQLMTGSGGTDIISCFMLGNPWQPVWPGEMQGPALGMDVQIFDDDGRRIVGKQGELVCCAPAPSMPVRFANDAGHVRFRKSYFERFPKIWTHGDFAEETAHGGFIIYGRSDAVLNPGGVRIGTAEIYRQVQTLPRINDSVAVGQQHGGDVRVVLFVTLHAGDRLDDALRQQIRDVLRRKASPRHVPKFIIEVPDIPRTRSGKIAETAVSALINGREPSQIHALANPDALDHFRKRAELQG